MSRWDEDCEACRRELQALIDGTGRGLQAIRTKHLQAASDGPKMFKEIADFIDGQLGKVDNAERVWIQPHAWKEGPRRMRPMLQEVANARQQIIEFAKQA
jgi:hypothetical protein